MLGVDGIKEIRRAHCREGRSIRGISRDLGVSRVTIRKVLRSGAMEFVYKRRTLMRTFEELRSLGYEGGTDAVRRHAASPAKAHVPLSFDPGDAYQFDWSHEDVVLGGNGVRAEVAHMRLCHSRMFFVRLMDDDHSLQGRMHIASMKDKYLLGMLANAAGKF